MYWVTALFLLLWFASLGAAASQGGQTVLAAVFFGVCVASMFGLMWRKHPERASMFMLPWMFALSVVGVVVLVMSSAAVSGLAVFTVLAAIGVLFGCAGTLAHSRLKKFELPDLLLHHFKTSGLEEDGVQFIVAYDDSAAPGDVCFVQVILQNDYDTARDVRVHLFTPVGAPRADVGLPLFGSCSLAPAQVGVLTLPLKIGVNASGQATFRVTVLVSGDVRGRLRPRGAPLMSAVHAETRTFTVEILPAEQGIPPAELVAPFFRSLWEKGDAPAPLRIPLVDPDVEPGKALTALARSGELLLRGEGVADLPDEDRALDASEGGNVR